MKRIVTIVVLICAVVFQMNAQVTVEHALKEAEQTKRFRYALPMITLSGKKYVIVQTADWNMEHPLVGWQLQNYMRTDEERNTFKDDETIICDDNIQFMVLPEEEKERRQMTFNFRYKILNPHKLEVNEGDARIWFLTPAAYNNILAKYREYKATNK